MFFFFYCNGTDGPLHCQRCGSPRPRRNDAQTDHACGPKRRLPAGHFSLASTSLVARIKMNLTAGNLHHQQLRNKANLNITGKILTQTAAKHMRISCMLEWSKKKKLYSMIQDRYCFYACLSASEVLVPHKYIPLHVIWFQKRRCSNWTFLQLLNYWTTARLQICITGSTWLVCLQIWILLGSCWKSSTISLSLCFIKICGGWLPTGRISLFT